MDPIAVGAAYGIIKITNLVVSMGWTNWQRRQIPKIASLEIERIQTLGKIELAEEELELLRKARERNAKDQIRHQKNLDKILGKAEAEIPEQVSPEPVSEDWLSDWVEKAKNYSDEQMQALWAKLLAGEIAKPGTFSPQTLAIVKTLNKDDANAFTKLCSCVARIPHDPFIISDGKHDLLSFDDITNLQSLGLMIDLHPGGTTVEDKETAGILVRFFDKAYYSKGNKKPINLGSMVLTRAGKELFAISGAVANYAYLSQMLESFKAQGFDFEEVNAVHQGGGTYHAKPIKRNQSNAK